MVLTTPYAHVISKATRLQFIGAPNLKYTTITTHFSPCSGHFCFWAEIAHVAQPSYTRLGDTPNDFSSKTRGLTGSKLVPPQGTPLWKFVPPPETSCPPSAFRLPGAPFPPRRSNGEPPARRPERPADDILTTPRPGERTILKGTTGSVEV